MKERPIMPLEISIVTSVTRWLDNLPNFLVIYDIEMLPSYNHIAKEVSKFSLIQYEPLYKCQRLLKCCQSSEILSNMVTLLVTKHKIKIEY